MKMILMMKAIMNIIINLYFRIEFILNKNKFRDWINNIK